MVWKFEYTAKGNVAVPSCSTSLRNTPSTGVLKPAPKTLGTAYFIPVSHKFNLQAGLYCNPTYAFGKSFFLFNNLFIKHPLKLPPVWILPVHKCCFISPCFITIPPTTTQKNAYPNPSLFTHQRPGIINKT